MVIVRLMVCSPHFYTTTVVNSLLLGSAQSDYLQHNNCPAIFTFTNISVFVYSCWCVKVALNDIPVYCWKWVVEHIIARKIATSWWQYGFWAYYYTIWCNKTVYVRWNSGNGLLEHTVTLSFRKELAMAYWTCCCSVFCNKQLAVGGWTLYHSMAYWSASGRRW